jgi:Ca2+-binding RTX toxin-like protein
LRPLAGNDRVIGTEDNDTANGNMGQDTLFGGDGDDYLRGGKDNDLLEGSSGNDILNGNLGDDTCRGGLGDDLVRGGQGNDVLFGDEGRDVLIGDLGSDFLYGGEDADDFILRGEIAGTDATTADRVLDFNPARGDRLGLSGIADLSEISVGAVDVNQDGIGDTAIIAGGDRVLGVVLDVQAAAFNLREWTFLASEGDLTLNSIG